MTEIELAALFEDPGYDRGDVITLDGLEAASGHHTLVCEKGSVVAKYEP